MGNYMPEPPELPVKLGIFLWIPQARYAVVENAGVWRLWPEELRLPLKPRCLQQNKKAPNLFDAVGTELSKIKSGTLAKAIAAGDESIKELMNKKPDLSASQWPISSTF